MPSPLNFHLSHYFYFERHTRIASFMLEKKFDVLFMLCLVTPVLFKSGDIIYCYFAFILVNLNTSHIVGKKAKNFSLPYNVIKEGHNL